MRRLEGRVAVVTGAASGIGRALSELLARRGCDLALVDVDEAGMRETADRTAPAGRRVSLHVADVSDRERMRRLPEEVIREHGHVHILVNNAGVTVTRTLAEHTLEDLEWIVGINLWGVLYGCTFFLPHLKREEEGHIVNLASMAAFLGLPLQSSYCATKFAVRGLSEALWAELAGTKVRVTGVYPGAVRTNLLRASRPSHPESTQRLAHLLERFARPPEDVARKIVRGIERDRMQVIVGAEARLTEWSKRFLPRLPHAALARMQRRLASRRRPPDGSGEAAAAEPAPRPPRAARRESN